MSQYLALFGQFWVPGLMLSALLILNTNAQGTKQIRWGLEVTKFLVALKGLGSLFDTKVSFFVKF